MVKLSKAERFVVAILIETAKGLGRVESRIVVGLKKTLDLANSDNITVVDLKEDTDVKEFTVDQVSLGWVKDRINETFKDKAVDPKLAHVYLALEEKLGGEDKDETV